MEEKMKIPTNAPQGSLDDIKSTLAAEIPEPQPALDSAQINPLEAPADPFGGGDTFTGEAVDVAGLGGVLGKVGKAVGKVAQKAVKTADDVAKAADDIKPPAIKPPEVKPPVTPKPGAYDPEKARALLNKDPELPPNSRRTDTRNFNMKKLQTPDDIKALIDDVARQNDGFESARRGVVTNEQTTLEAQTVSIEQLTGRKPSEAWNASQIKAGHEILLETGRRIVELKDAWKAGKATSDEDLLMFRQLLGQHAAVQEQLSGAAAEAGRALQIFNSVTQPGGKLRAMQVRDALEAMGGRDGVEKMIELVDQIGADPASLAKIARKTAWRRTADAISEWTINSMLSGPATHMANITGNVLAMSLHPLERATAAGIGKLLPGKSTVQIGEAAQMFAVTQGIKDGLRLGWRAIKTGEGVQGKIEAHRPAITAANFNMDEGNLFGKGVDLFGEWYVRLPGKAMQGTDEFFKAISSRMELNARAYRQAASEGMEGKAFGVRVQQLINDPPDEMLADAESFARYSTFTNSLWEGKGLLSKAGQAGQSVFADHPVAKLVIAPFIRTPVNIAKYIVERSPLEVVSPDFWNAMKVGGAKRELALARVSLGTMVATAMMSEYFTEPDENGVVNRKITGSGPDDPTAKAALLATGWQPNSILIDGKYVSYNRADPFGAVIGMYANALDIMEYAADDATIDETAAAVVLGTAESLMSKSYMSSLSEFFDVLTQKPGATLTGFAASQAGKPIPSWLNTVAKAADTDEDGNPILRDTRTGDALDQVLKTIKGRIPGLASGLPAKRDIWGEEIVKGGKISVLTPFPVSKAKDEQITARLIELDAVPGKLGKVVTYHGQTFDLVEADDGAGWIFNRYQEAAGKYARQILEKANLAEMNQTYDFDSIPPEGIEKLQGRIRDVYRDARQAAILVSVAQLQGVIAKDDKLPGMDELPDLAAQIDMEAAAALYKARAIGSRNLPPHMTGAQSER